MEWILFYYNSLPDMPKECPRFSTQIMHRDFFMCNPNNTGHYRYPKFETLSYDDECHYREVHNFLCRPDPEKYVIFYTRHTSLKGNGQPANKIVGYFRVGEQFEQPRKGFFASECVLLPKEKCVALDYTARGVPVSWGNSSANAEVNSALRDMIADPGKSIAASYQEETSKIMDLLQGPNGRQQIMDTCGGCSLKNNCYWGRKSEREKEAKLTELYVANPLVDSLATRQSTDLVFNQYQEERTRKNLKAYLAYLLRHGRNVLLVGEAPGYLGCKITGIPFTSGSVIHRSRNPLFKKKMKKANRPYSHSSETTAGIVWGFLDGKADLPILWNAFPFHAHQEGQPESNRQPTQAEIEEGKVYLRAIHDLFKPKKVYGLGKVGQRSLKATFPTFPNETIEYVRHPSHGGKNAFVQSMANIYDG